MPQMAILSHTIPEKAAEPIRVGRWVDMVDVNNRKYKGIVSSDPLSPLPTFAFPLDAKYLLMYVIYRELLL